MSVLTIDHKKIPEKGILDLGDLKLVFEDVGSNKNLRVIATNGSDEELNEGLFDTKDTDALIDMLQGFRSEIGLRG